MVQNLKKNKKRIEKYQGEGIDYIFDVMTELENAANDQKKYNETLKAGLKMIKILQARKDKLEEKGIIRGTLAPKNNGVQLLIPSMDHKEHSRIRIYIPKGEIEETKKWIERKEEHEKIVRSMEEIKGRISQITYQINMSARVVFNG